MTYYKVSQVADLLGKTRQWVWVLIISKRLKAKKKGRLYFVSEDALNSFLNKKAGRKKNGK